MSAADFSVVMPTADRRLFAERAIRYWRRSCRALGPRLRGELVIVDSGSWPLDPAMVGVGERIVRAEPGTITGDARNLGIQASTGRRVICQDDDDHYSAGWLSAWLDALDRNPGGVVGCSYHLRYDLFLRQAVGQSWASSFADRPAGSAGCLGGTLGFWREVWSAGPFRSIRIGEDQYLVADYTERTGRRLAQVERGGDLFVYISHALNVTGRRPILGDAANTARAREILGEDLSWYDSIAEICNGGAIHVRGPNFHRPPTAQEQMAGMRGAYWGQRG